MNEFQQKINDIIRFLSNSHIDDLSFDEIEVYDYPIVTTIGNTVVVDVKKIDHKEVTADVIVNSIVVETIKLTYTELNWGCISKIHDIITDYSKNFT